MVKSRWTLDLKGQSGTVVEINARFADREADPEGRTDSDSLEIERQEPLPAKELPKLDDRLAKIANIILSGRRDFLPAAIVWSLLLLRMERTEVIRESGGPVYLFCYSRLTGDCALCVLATSRISED